MHRMLSLAAATTAAVALAAFPVRAIAAWSTPFEVSPAGSGVLGAELANNGVLRAWWQTNNYTGRRTSGVSLMTHTGHVQTLKPTALERDVPSADWGGSPYYQLPVFLADGRALRCLVTGTETRARISLLVYSPAGTLVRKLLVAAQPEDSSGLIIAPSCQVSTAADGAVVEFTQQTASGRDNQGARQIYVARLLPGLRVSAPVAVLTPGAGQLTFIPQTDTEQVSISPTGWVAVTWAYDDIIKEADDKTAQRWQWRMSWVSPTGTVGPVTSVLPMQGGHFCNDSSGNCIHPAVPVVRAVADDRVLVVFGWPHLRSEEVDGAGHVSAWSTASRQAPFEGPDATPASSSQVASGGGTVLVTWQGGRPTLPVYAARWHKGRWSKPAVLATRTPTMYPTDPLVTVNERGDASVYWYWAPFRPTLGAYVQAAFDF